MTKQFENKTAIVTGGNAGIGRAIVKALALQGAKVAIFGTNQTRGQETVEQVNGEVGHAAVSFYQVDMSDSEAVRNTISEIIDGFGKLDLLVNNAGITRDQLLMKMSEEDWDRVQEVNLKACFTTCKAVMRPHDAC